MTDCIERCDAVLYGCGEKTDVYEKFLDKYSNVFNIIAIVDGGLEIKHICNIPIFDINIAEIGCYCIIMNEQWDIIYRNFKVCGKKLHNDFDLFWYLELENKNILSYTWMMKEAKKTKAPIIEYLTIFSRGRKYASVFGNCQSTNIIKMLGGGSLFSR